MSLTGPMPVEEGKCFTDINVHVCTLHPEELFIVMLRNVLLILYTLIFLL